MRPREFAWPAALLGIGLGLATAVPGPAAISSDFSAKHPGPPAPSATQGVAYHAAAASVALDPLLVAADATTSNGSSYPLGTVSMRAGHVYVAFLTLSETGKAVDDAPGVVGGGTTWTQVDGGEATSSSMGMTAYWFAPETDLGGVSLSTGPLSAGHEGLVHAIVEVATGAGTGTVVQYAGGRAGPAHRYSRTLPAPPGPDATVVGAFAHAAAEESAPDPGWDELPGSDLSHGRPPRSMHVIHDATAPGATAGSSWATAKPRRGIVLEVAPAGAAGSAEPGPAGAGVTVVAAGDLCGGCGRTSQRAVEADPDAVITLGDLAYSNGLLSEFRQKYGGGTVPETRWGRPRLKGITLPGYGNHDCYDVPRATGATKQGCDDAVTYMGPDSAFGTDIPGTPGSYYTVLGDWLVVHLNSAGDTGSGKATAAEVTQQRAELAQILAADDHRCEVVVWHHPWRSSGKRGNNAFVDSWFDAAYANGVDLLLSGHDHDYERFAPMDPAGTLDPAGVQQFVVGSGGIAPREFALTAQPNSEVRIVDRGILVLELTDDGYTWEFRDDVTGEVDDSGTRPCHS